MVWRFGAFELDPARFELREDGEVLRAEPKVLQLLQYLIEHRDRMVSKDELVDAIWGGRAISDSALSSCIKFARKLVGDDGRTQLYIRTVHGRGFRFIGDIQGAPIPAAVHSAEPDTPIELVEPVAGAKPSIAVLPFRLIGIGGPYAGIAEAFPTDLIADLSRLKWLFVIARASSFRLRGTGQELSNVGRRLGVRYALTGVVELVGDMMILTVELGDTRTGGIVWTDRFEARLDAIHDVRRELAAAIIAAIELQIPLHEAQQSRLVAPENLDAWAAYHVGLSHLFKGSSDDMAQAQAMFERAIQLESDFARAMAGLSSAHFLRAFVHRDRAARAEAHRFAEMAIAQEPNDPFVNMAMGRSLWLEDDLEGSLEWLERATSLNPNFAQAIYSRGWTETLLGQNDRGDERAQLSLQLSPLDPLVYAMLGVRSFAAMGRGDAEAAATLGNKSARSPGAHALIQLLAVVGNGYVGDDAQARHFADRARAMAPGISRETYHRAFPFRDAKMRGEVDALLRQYGF